MVIGHTLRMQAKRSPLNRLRQTSAILNPQRMFSSVKQGSKYSLDFKQYLQLSNGEIGSYFHDIPIGLNFKGKTVTMICEVPRWSNAKFEVSKDLKFNPIIQDTKKGEPRFVHNIFPFHGYIHNYGAIPQTWEDPTMLSIIGKESLQGDNDPLDCCEIGSSIMHTGDVKTVKILGSLALIDDGELDWKIIAINVEDPIASQVENLDDVNLHLPGILDATREWFRNYKIPAGKPPNSFAFHEQYRNVNETLETIQECHEAWKRLLDGSLSNNSSQILPQIVRAGGGVKLESEVLPPKLIPAAVHKWWYI